MAKIKPGEMPTAADWNRHDELADLFHRTGRLGEGGGGFLDSFGPLGLVGKVRNDSGSTANRFDILAISDILITPTANLEEFYRQPAVIGDTPAGTPDFGKWVLCLAPIVDGGIGRCMFMGISAAIVNIVDTGHGFADVDSGNKRLKSQSSGAAELLYQESGTGDKKCLIRMGAMNATESIGKLSVDLDTDRKGTLTLWKIVDADPSYTPTVVSPTETMEVVNATGQTLKSGVLLKTITVQHSTFPLVEPLEYGPC